MRKCLAGLLMAASSLSVGADVARGGSTSAEIVRTDFSARVAAMGGQMPAGARGTEALWYNPAGLAVAPYSEILLNYNSHALDVNQGALAYSGSVGRGGWGIYLNYLDYGAQDRTTIITTGAVVTGSRFGTFDAWDMVGGIGYAGRFWNDELALGMTGKIIYSSLDDVSATAFAADLGAEYLPSNLPASFGLALKNLGTPLRYDVAREDLPLTLEFGATGRFLDERLHLHAGLEKNKYEKLAFRGGLELRPFRTVPLRFRGGYDATQDADDGWSAGLGAEWTNLDVDYAYQPFGDFGSRHRFGLKYVFERYEEFRPSSRSTGPALRPPPARSSDAPPPAIRKRPQPIRIKLAR